MIETIYGEKHRNSAVQLKIYMEKHKRNVDFLEVAN